jgi:ribosomal protein S12 methylthiotransferase accessory factor
MGKLRLARSISYTVHPGIGIVFRSDLGTFKLDGTHADVVASRILPLLDSTRDEDRIAADLPQYSPKSIAALLSLLRQHGVIEDVHEGEGSWDARLRGQDEFFRKFGVNQSRECLRVARVMVAGLEPWSVQAALDLSRSGLGSIVLCDSGKIAAEDPFFLDIWPLDSAGNDRSLTLRDLLSARFPKLAVEAGSFSPEKGLDDPAVPIDLVIDGFPPEALFEHRRLAEWCQRHSIKSLHGHVDGLHAVIGPVVIPGATACWECLRVRRHPIGADPKAEESVLQALLAGPAIERMRMLPAAMAAAAGSLIALEALKLLTAYAPATIFNRFLRLDLTSFDSSLHPFLPLPYCELCGGISATGKGGNPGGRPTTAASGHGQSLASITDVAEMRHALEFVVDERAGIVSKVVINHPEVSDPETPFTATAATRTAHGGLLEHAHWELGSGKGLDRVGAFLGAVGEAVERYSASVYQRSHLLRARCRDLSGPYLDPRALCLYSDEQQAGADFPFARFDPEHPLDWVEAKWLDGEGPVWVPALTTFYNFRAPSDELFCQVTSNGLAAGSSLADANTRAFLELMERDAFMMTWLCRKPARQIELGGADPDTLELVRQLKEKGTQAQFFLLSSEAPLFCVMAVAFGDGENWPGATVALSAHFSFRDALRKAALELGHVAPYIRRLMHEQPQTFESPEQVTSLLHHALFYVPASRQSAFEFLRGERISAGQLSECLPSTLTACLAALKAQDIRVAVADVTSPDLCDQPFRVARALGTNVQPIHFGHRLTRWGNPRLIRQQPAAGFNPWPHPLA